MKKIVYGVYHNINYEARSKEMLECLCQIGKVDFVSFAKPEGIKDVNSHIINKASPFALISFIQEMKRTILSVQPDIVALHDHDCSAIIPFVKKHFPNAKIYYDSSELYIRDASKKKRVNFNNGLLIVIKARLTSFRGKCEKKYLKDADLVFAANKERAEIMKDYFGLKDLPIVFDNIHRIDDNFDCIECDNKFGGYFDKAAFNILFAGGIDDERKTFDYIQSFKQLGAGYNLIIAGMASQKSLQRFKKMTEGCNNIHFLGFITRAELRYCMKNSQASVVIFDEDSYNTKYCASGKCYESLFEGVPILASENPPLKRLCDENGIGVSSNNYSEAIKELKDNYDFYQQGAIEFVKKIDYEKRLERLTDVLRRYGEI